MTTEDVRQLLKLPKYQAEHAAVAPLLSDFVSKMDEIGRERDVAEETLKDLDQRQIEALDRLRKLVNEALAPRKD